MGLGLLYHISVQELEEPKMSQTSVDVVFTQDRSRLVVVDCGCMMQFSNTSESVVAKIGEIKPNGGIECRNLF